MIIKALVENTSLSPDLGCEHGLSLYIETKNKKILFDTGAGSLFLDNAEKLEVPIEDVDVAVISHGHYDHGGGLGRFLQANTKAKVLIRPRAFESHSHEKAGEDSRDIGIDRSLKDNPRMVLTDDRFVIAEGIEVFSNVRIREPRPVSNVGLMMTRQGVTEADDFDHEQNLMITEDGFKLLMTGCAHNGILNILAHYQDLTGTLPDLVIGGFHLAVSGGKAVDQQDLESLAGKLLATEAKFYTCHCTGLEAYSHLKEMMGDRIDYLSAGQILNL